MLAWCSRRSFADRNGARHVHGAEEVHRGGAELGAPQKDGRRWLELGRGDRRRRAGGAGGLASALAAHGQQHRQQQPARGATRGNENAEREKRSA